MSKLKLFRDAKHPGYVRWEHDPMAGMIVGLHAPEVMAMVNAFHSPGREIATEQITEGLVWTLVDLLKDVSAQIDASDGTVRMPRIKEAWAWEQKVRALLAKLESQK